MTMTTDLPLSASEAIDLSLGALFTQGENVDAGHWQGYPTEGKPDLQTRELLNMNFTCAIPPTPEGVANECRPINRWAELEFSERVGRVPHNPHESLSEWPWWRGQQAHTMDSYGQFTHTYSERFWPKTVGKKWQNDDGSVSSPTQHWGLRYAFGDLDDVVELLRQHPHTRQATFPIFFPEDTGARHGGRIPCTLHYHFMLRANRLHMWYPLRSCDAVRHFRDDVYMAMRLCQWVLEELRNGADDYPNLSLWEMTVPGTLCFTAYSFHVHMGDWHHLVNEVTR